MLRVGLLFATVAMLWAVPSPARAADQLYVSTDTADLHLLGNIERGEFSLTSPGNLSVKTIDTHRDHIRSKLQVGHSAELIRFAVQWVLENG